MIICNFFVVYSVAVTFPRETESKCHLIPWKTMMRVSHHLLSSRVIFNYALTCNLRCNFPHNEHNAHCHAALGNN